MGGVERVILSLGTFEKVKFYKARHLVEMTVARQPNCSKVASRGLAKRKRFMAINIRQALPDPDPSNNQA
jgi:hypothetical protein